MKQLKQCGGLTLSVSSSFLHNPIPEVSIGIVRGCLAMLQNCQGIFAPCMHHTSLMPNVGLRTCLKVQVEDT
eukprot:1153689-Pelagomonas_calceolata.AAC.3